MRVVFAFCVGVCVGALLAGSFCVRVCVSLLDEDEARLQWHLTSTTHPPVQASPAWWTTGPTRRRASHPEA